MSVEENKAIVRRSVEHADRADLPFYDEIYAPNVRMNGQPMGIEGMRQYSAMINAAFPDRRSIIEDMIAEGDRVVVRWTMTGTHTGDLPSPSFGRIIPATGKAVSMTGIDIHRLAGERIVEEISEADRLGLYQQLGVIPSLEQQAGR